MNAYRKSGSTYQRILDLVAELSQEEFICLIKDLSDDKRFPEYGTGSSYCLNCHVLCEVSASMKCKCYPEFPKK